MALFAKIQTNYGNAIKCYLEHVFSIRNGEWIGTRWMEQQYQQTHFSGYCSCQVLTSEKTCVPPLSFAASDVLITLRSSLPLKPRKKVTLSLLLGHVLTGCPYDGNTTVTPKDMVISKAAGGLSSSEFLTLLKEISPSQY